MAILSPIQHNTAHFYTTLSFFRCFGESQNHRMDQAGRGSQWVQPPCSSVVIQKRTAQDYIGWFLNISSEADSKISLAACSSELSPTQLNSVSCSGHFRFRYLLLLIILIIIIVIILFYFPKGSDY